MQLKILIPRTSSYLLILKQLSSVSQQSKHPTEESKREKGGQVLLATPPKDGPCCEGQLLALLQEMDEHIDRATQRVNLRV